MEKRRVLVYTDCYIYGGSERLMVFLLTNKLLNEKYEFILAYRNHKDYATGLSEDFRKWDITTKVYPLRLLDNTTLFYKINLTRLPGSVKLLIKVPFFLLEKLGAYFAFNFFPLFFFLKRNRFDIIHVNNGGYPGARTCNHITTACALSGLDNIIYQVNNQAFPSKSRFARIFDKWIGSKVSYFITASGQARQSLISKRGFQEQKVVQIPNTVKPEQLVLTRKEILLKAGWPEDTFLLVNVAFLTRRKGQIFLLESLSRLINECKVDNMRLILVGNGEDEELLKDYIRKNKLEPYVWMAGYQSNSNDYINAADIFILPSISNEDMPLALLTAMSQGKTIIATGFAGIREAIKHQENGILLEQNEQTLSDQVADAILRLYRDPVLRTQCGTNARSTFQNVYSENAYGTKLSALYETATAENTTKANR